MSSSNLQQRHNLGSYRSRSQRCVHFNDNHPHSHNQRYSPHPNSPPPTFINRLLDFDLNNVFPFTLVPSLRHLIDATWRCFQYRYQLIPIRLPGGECDEEEERQRQLRLECQRLQYQHCCDTHQIPSCISLHNCYENICNHTQSAAMFSNNCQQPSPAPPGCCGGQSVGRRRSLTRTCSAMNTCHCCTCCCCTQRPVCIQQHRPRTLVSRIHPCMRHANMLDNLQDPCCEPPNVCTRASTSRVNLNVRVITRSPSDCSSSADEPPPPRRKVCWEIPEECRDVRKEATTAVHQISQSTCTSPIDTTNKSCSAEVAPCVDNATSTLISEGVDLLKEGARIMERSCEMVDSKTTAALQETAAKLTEAIEGQLKILREENEILRTTNSIMRSQLTATQLSQAQSNSSKATGGDSTKVRDDATLTEEPQISVLHDYQKSVLRLKDKGANTDLPTLAASELSVGEVPPTRKPEEKWLEMETNLQNQMECLENKITSLEETCEMQAKQLVCLQEKVFEVDVLKNQMSCLDGRASALQQTCDNQAKQLEALQEKLHRQEIRYHDTIGKFDETIQSMKIMFDGLKKAIPVPTTQSITESTAISSSSSGATTAPAPPKAKAKKK